MSLAHVRMEHDVTIKFDPSILYHCFQLTSVSLAHVRMELHVIIKFDLTVLFYCSQL